MSQSLTTILVLSTLMSVVAYLCYRYFFGGWHRHRDSVEAESAEADRDHGSGNPFDFESDSSNSEAESCSSMFSEHASGPTRPSRAAMLGSRCLISMRSLWIGLRDAIDHALDRLTDKMVDGILLITAMDGHSVAGTTAREFHIVA